VSKQEDNVTDNNFDLDRANWHMNACLDPHSGNDFAYREGYKMAGKILTEWAAQNGWVDFLVYPVCHSYRHYVELTLKHLMVYGCRLAEREMTLDELKRSTHSHDLRLLWDCCKKIEQDVAAVTGESFPSAELDEVTSYIEQLRAVDEDSISFRYALNKEGNVSLGPRKHINLAAFAEAMERLCTSLEIIGNYYGGMLSQLDSMKRDQSST
jgi:hypothetical protein